MNQSLVSISDFADSFTAETVRIRLAAEGIQAIVTGTDAATALGFGGAGTNRLVRLEVAQQDYQRAVDLLRGDEERLQSAQPWICSRCDEPNEPAFEVCWSCNKERTEEDPVGRIDDEDHVEEVASHLGDFSAPPSPSAQVPDDKNPYRPFPLTDPNEKVVAVNQPPQRMDEQIHGDVRRAVIAAVVGLVFFPAMTNFYSVFLLLSIPTGAYQDEQLRFRIISAWIINVVSISTWVTIGMTQFAP